MLDWALVGKGWWGQQKGGGGDGSGREKSTTEGIGVDNERDELEADGKIVVVPLVASLR